MTKRELFVWVFGALALASAHWAFTLGLRPGDAPPVANIAAATASLGKPFEDKCKAGYAYVISLSATGGVRVAERRVVDCQKKDVDGNLVNGSVRQCKDRTGDIYWGCKGDGRTGEVKCSHKSCWEGQPMSSPSLKALASGGSQTLQGDTVASPVLPLTPLSNQSILSAIQQAPANAGQDSMAALPAGSANDFGPTYVAGGFVSGAGENAGTNRADAGTLLPLTLPEVRNAVGLSPEYPGSQELQIAAENEARAVLAAQPTFTGPTEGGEDFSARTRTIGYAPASEPVSVESFDPRTVDQLEAKIRAELSAAQAQERATIDTLNPEAVQRGEDACASAPSGSLCTRYRAYDVAVQTAQTEVLRVANNYDALQAAKSGGELRPDLAQTLATMEKGQGPSSAAFDSAAGSLAKRAQDAFSPIAKSYQDGSWSGVAGNAVLAVVPGGNMDVAAIQEKAKDGDVGGVIKETAIGVVPGWITGGVSYFGSVLTNDAKVAAEAIAPDALGFNPTPEQAARCGAVGADTCGWEAAGHAANVGLNAWAAGGLMKSGAGLFAPLRVEGDVAAGIRAGNALEAPTLEFVQIKPGEWGLAPEGAQVTRAEVSVAAPKLLEAPPAVSSGAEIEPLAADLPQALGVANAPVRSGAIAVDDLRMYQGAPGQGPTIVLSNDARITTSGEPGRWLDKLPEVVTTPEAYKTFLNLYYGEGATLIQTSEGLTYARSEGGRITEVNSDVYNSLAKLGENIAQEPAPQSGFVALLQTQPTDLSPLYRPDPIPAPLWTADELPTVPVRDVVGEAAPSRGLTVDPESRAAIVNGQPVALTRQQYDIVQYLEQNKDRVVSREELLSQVYGDAERPKSADSGLSVQINRIRGLLQEADPQQKYLVTVGAGNSADSAAGGYRLFQEGHTSNVLEAPYAADWNTPSKPNLPETPPLPDAFQLPLQNFSKLSFPSPAPEAWDVAYAAPQEFGSSAPVPFIKTGDDLPFSLGSFGNPNAEDFLPIHAWEPIAAEEAKVPLSAWQTVPETYEITPEVRQSLEQARANFLENNPLVDESKVPTVKQMEDMANSRAENPSPPSVLFDNVGGKSPRNIALLMTDTLNQVGRSEIALNLGHEDPVQAGNVISRFNDYTARLFRESDLAWPTNDVAARVRPTLEPDTAFLTSTPEQSFAGLQNVIERNDIYASYANSIRRAIDERLADPNYAPVALEAVATNGGDLRSALYTLTTEYFNGTPMRDIASMLGYEDATAGAQRLNKLIPSLLNEADPTIPYSFSPANRWVIGENGYPHGDYLVDYSEAASGFRAAASGVSGQSVKNALTEIQNSLYPSFRNSALFSETDGNVLPGLVRVANDVVENRTPADVTARLGLPRSDIPRVSALMQRVSGVLCKNGIACK